jgi:ribonucleoside-diphosphate reductase alpha chain
MTLPTEYQEFIALSRYARWLPEENRRETWEETVDRYVSYMGDKCSVPSDVCYELKDAILSLEVMPSMRALMTAGEALDRDNVAGFNCAYMAMNRQRSFDELMYILMCGTGVGFSCERTEVKKLPMVSESMHETDSTIIVSDSKIGWASAFRELISLLYSGKIPKWELSRVRAAGEQLKTFGGRASGPEPLDDLFKYSVNLFSSACGRQLTSLEVHGLVCKIAEIVVVGGVRRSALISLSSFSDDRLRHAKSGKWWLDHPEFALANNSVAYTEKPDVEAFMREWSALVESKSGERGIFNREASKRQAAKNGRRDAEYSFGTNPCSEIILRDRQFCNLSEVVVRAQDTFDDLKRKVRLATILGTLQSTLTDFRYLSKAWKDNTEEERLLGVSLTGIMDHPVLSGSSGSIKGWGSVEPKDLAVILKELKEVAIETNKEWANKLGINESVAITCVKPSGTVSQLVDSASGIHSRHSPYYIRTVRADKKDPLAILMYDAGFPAEDDVSKPDSTYVFSFPMKAPENAVFRNDRTAIEQLEVWMVYQRHWCEHKPSVTISVKEQEWLDVGAWVYKNFDEVSGVSFLPYDGGSYRQAPYQEITEEEYNVLKNKMPTNVDWNSLADYESEDNTVGSQTYACTGTTCEVVDL